MRWSEYIVLIVSMLVTGGLCGQVSTDTGFLWNVTESGDTLRYVNNIPFRTQVEGGILPKYLPPAEFQKLMRAATNHPDSQMVRTNAVYYKQINVPQLPEAKELEPTYARVWKPVLSMAVTGALSAYFKLEANKAYSRYEHSLDHATIEKYYNLSRKYDTYSAISFVFLQGSFGWLIYKLLW